MPGFDHGSVTDGDQLDTRFELQVRKGKGPLDQYWASADGIEPDAESPVNPEQPLESLLLIPVGSDGIESHLDRLVFTFLDLNRLGVLR